MEPILETEPPFVIKIYDTYFHISGDSLSDKMEDKFFYEQIKSVEIKKEKLKPSLLESLGEFLGDIMLSSHAPLSEEKNIDELCIEFKTGKVERRYFNGVSSDKYIDAVELLKTKIINS